MGDRILLIGGGGFLGTALAENLAQRRLAFTVLSRSKTCPERLSQVFKQCGDLGTYASGDCRDKRFIDELIARHTHVIHLAYANMRGVSCADPSTELMDNLSCATNVFDSAARHGKKIVLISSGGTVYGSSGKIPINEEHRLAPISSYGLTKVAIENCASHISQTIGLKYMILRPGNAYGIGQIPFRGQGFVATAIASVLRAEPVLVFGRPGAVRDYVYITDMAEAIALAMEKGEYGKSYNIGSGRGNSNDEILHEIERLVALDGLVVQKEYLPSRPQDVGSIILDASRLAQKTDWRPVVGLTEGLERTYAWLKNYLHD